MLENILYNHNIIISESARVFIVEKGMDYEDEYDFLIVFSADHMHTLIDVIQGLEQDDFQRNMFLGKQGDTLVPIAIETVTYFNALGNDTYANLNGTCRLKIKYKLYQLEEGLLPNHFIRINKSEIVNIKKIKTISPMFKGNLLIYLDNYKTPFDISRNYIKNFKERLGIR